MWKLLLAVRPGVETFLMILSELVCAELDRLISGTTRFDFADVFSRGKVDVYKLNCLSSANKTSKSLVRLGP